MPVITVPRVSGQARVSREEVVKNPPNDRQTACPGTPQRHPNGMTRVAAALSCFQGELSTTAASSLIDLGFSALQLTPGCVPSPDLEGVLKGVKTTTHHGWSPRAMRRKVWADRALVTHADSVHPPLERDACWFWELDPHTLPIIEVMYPSYTLGTGREIRRAMEARMRLAVDVSHLWIQLQSNACTQDDVDALFAYDNVAEIHVSHNDGTRDSHSPLSVDSYGLGWAAERTDVPVVFEGYLHRLTDHQRRSQVELLAGVLG